MSFRHALGASLVAFVVLGTGVAAKDARIVITAEGKSAGSAPKFRLWADGRLVGEAELGRSPEKSAREVAPPQGKDLEHYDGRFEFIVRNIERVRRLGIGFSTKTGSSHGKPGALSLTLTGISVDGVPLDPKAFLPGAVGGEEIGPTRVVLTRDGLYRIKRPAGGWAEFAGKGPAAQEAPREKNEVQAASPAIASEKRKKAEAARIALEEKRKAEAAKLAAQARKKEEAGRLAAAKETRRKLEAARIAAEEARRKAEAARIALEEERAKLERAWVALEEQRTKAEAARLDVAGGAGQNEPAPGDGTTASGSCKDIAALEITGYEETAAELPNEATGQVARLATSLKGSRCRIRITAYASMDMFPLPSAHEVKPDVERRSMARAAAVARELESLGVAADRITTATSIGGRQRVLVTAQ
jgi:hypothetical protein